MAAYTQHSSAEVKKVTVLSSVVSGERDTPFSNTGYDSPFGSYEIGLDWLDFSVHQVSGSVEAESIIAAIASLTSEQMDFSPTRSAFNGRSWSGSGRGSAGTMIWYSAPSVSPGLLSVDALGQYVGYEDILPPRRCIIDAVAIASIAQGVPDGVRLFYRPEVAEYGVDHGWRLDIDDEYVDELGVLKVAMSAKVLSRCDLSLLHAFLSSMKGLKFSRIDVALDDMDRLVPMEWVESAARKGDYFDARWRMVIESGERTVAVGKTVYFGSPASDKRLRVYDKTVESKGVRDCIRWEVELRRKKADVFGHDWLGRYAKSPAMANDFLTAVVVGSVDFRDRGSESEKNRDRCPMLPWWSAMLRRLAVVPVKVRVANVVPSIQKSVDWLNKSVASSLSAVSKVLGDHWPNFMSELLLSGGEKMDRIKREQVEVTCRSSICY